jgi:glycosyltransferase involved in cell wall biosynthesis
MNASTSTSTSSVEDAIRILPELRASQIIDFLNVPVRNVYYFREHYDVQDAVVPPEIQRLSVFRTSWRALISNASVLEIPEPLWARMLPSNVLIATAWQIGGYLRGRRRRARAYAIENNSPILALTGRELEPKLVSALILIGVGLLTRVLYERIAFGSDGAQSTYHQVPFVKGISSRVFLELPIADPRANPRSTTPPQRAIFIGQLERRKGIAELQRAWEFVEEQNPTAVLEIVGVGNEEESVRIWASQKSASRVCSGRIPHGLLGEHLSRATVLVAPSMRDGRWREQIGLPIVEALSEGLTVVTSSETGLAEWLKEAGHTVIDVAEIDSKLPHAILAALERPLASGDVLNSLPARPGRACAGAWLLLPNPRTAGA